MTTPSEFYACRQTTCAMNGVELPQAAVVDTEYRCHLCRSRLEAAPKAGGSSTSAAQWPPNLDPLDLPTHVAIPLERYLLERNPRVQLHWLVDTAEICVRWVTAVTVAEIAADNDGRLPDALAHRIRNLVERPTLGGWVRMLRTMIDHAPSNPRLAASFFSLIDSVLSRRFRSSPDPEGRDSKTPSILALRNHLVHCGGLSIDAASRCLTAHRAGFEQMVAAVAQAGKGLAVFAVDGDRKVWLRGPSALNDEPPEILSAVDDGTWLVSLDGVDAISLRPIITYRPVLSIDDGWRRALIRDEEIASPAEPVPQVYFRFDNERLSYTPLGTDASVSIDLGSRPFREFFRLDQVSSQQEDENTEAWDRFLLEARIKHEALVGRERELETVKSWVKNTRKMSASEIPRIGWIHGKPGLGKSLLMAKLAHDAANGRRESRQVYFHAFRANDPHNSRRALLRGLQGALRTWEAFRDSSLEHPVRLEGADLEEDVRRLIGRIPDLPPGKEETPPRLFIYLDGLDEVAKLDPELPELILSLTRPGTIWVVAGRPEPPLMRAFVPPVCKTIFADGLPPMDDVDVRAMLLDGLADAGHRLAALDSDSTDPNVEVSVFNPFLHEVVQRAGGAPIYVRLLLEELQTGKRRIEDPPGRLPKDLDDYYRTLLLGQGVAFDVNAHLGLILCLLAASEEPLDRGTFAQLFRFRPTLADNTKLQRWIDAACDLGRVLLTPALVPDGGTGLTLYHLSLKEWLIGDPQQGIAPAPEMEGSMDQAQWLLTEAAQHCLQLEDGSLQRHVLRCGCRYLLQWRWQEGLRTCTQLLTDAAVLARIRSAWGDDGAGFYLSLHDTTAELARATEAPTTDIARALLECLLTHENPRVELETAHAVLNYRPDKTFYLGFLALGDDPVSSHWFREQWQEVWRTTLRGRRANLLRKAGKLKQSLALLNQNRECFLALPPTPERDQELARTEYDAGYVNYLRGDFANADKHLADSVHYASLAGDVVGAWISRCVRARFAALACMNDEPARYASALANFHDVLCEALTHFEHEGRQSDNQHALRWIMNVHAHRFEVAFARDDLPVARECIEALHSDLWVRRLAPPGFLDRYDARLLLLAERFADAATVFSRFLTLTDDGADAVLRQEEVASHYYYYGCALNAAGKPEQAQHAWQTGLRAPADNGNSHWRPRLEEKTAALARS